MNHKRGCLVLDIKRLQRIQDYWGDIFVFEGHRFDFPIRRVYFTKNVAVGETRGHHAHKLLEQMLICPHGAIEITLDDGIGCTETMILENPEDAIHVGPSIWHTMKWLRPESILLVYASRPYEESDYIREYAAFRNFVARRRSAI